MKINKRILKKYCICSMLLFCFISVPFMPVNAAANHETKKLSLIKRQIQRLKNFLGQTHRERTHLQKKLKKAETDIGKIAIRYRANLALQKKRKAILKKLNTRYRRYEKEIANEQALFNKEVKLAYMLGQANHLKVLLNQEDPEKLNRMLTYHLYFSKHRQAVIDNHQKALARLEASRQKIYRSEERLATINRRLKRQRMQLENERGNRQQLLKKMHRTISSKKNQLERLVKSKKALQHVLSRVEKNSMTYYPPEGISFARLRGRLPWPVHGKISRQFGAQIEHSKLTWKGVVIDSTRGKEVHAIAAGRVAFAKWLTGYGLLLIIDHGQGYMTLYGRNNSLYKKQGDRVIAGDTVATVGQSGGYEKAALYFAIRKKNVPLNPNRWCKS